MPDYFESHEHEVYEEHIMSLLEAGEFVPEGSLPNGWGEIRYPRKPDYPCKWVDNEWVRLTDEEIEEEKQREAERLQREAELKLKERKELEEKLLRANPGVRYWTEKEKEDFFRRAWEMWDAGDKYGHKESWFEEAWGRTRPIFDKDGNEITELRF